MRIAQITPGLIPIPPNGWGAVEKIIWEYTKVLRSLGHEVKILYANDINPNDWDIVHVHVANLALILKERGIPYIFSHHDHHAYHFGKDSPVYKENMEAIEGSVVSFVHAKYLVEYFGGGDKIRYLGHGVNINDYLFSDRTQEVRAGKYSLLMLANNGLGGDKMYDRKGFRYGIEAARNLNLPITIICPGINSDLISSIDPYENMTVRYDLGYSDALDEICKHHIFLNPSMLEAGHPNLTVTEMISLGIPVIGTSESEMLGLKRIKLGEDLKIGVSDIILGISEVISKYPQMVLECEQEREFISWEVIVSKMLMDYSNYSKIDQKELILSSYRVPIIKDLLSDSKGFDCSFNGSIYAYKSINTPSIVSVLFKDRRTNKIIHRNNFSKSSKSWVMYPDSSDKFIDWEITFKLGDRVLFSKNADLNNNHVLVYGNLDQSHSEILRKFEESTGCIISTSDSYIDGFFKSEGSHDFYYRKLNISQILDYFIPANQIADRTLIKLETGSLGDNISFVPYANEYGKIKGNVVDVMMAHKSLFLHEYEWINFVESDNLHDYTNYIAIDYIFEKPLQEGTCYQLNLNYKEIRPKIGRRDSKNIPSGKYVCFSMHSTAQAKHWNYPDGWEKLCSELKLRGIEPVCIDRHESFGIEGNRNKIPSNCTNLTGGNLERMMEIISGCEFFVGLSSGLSWLAHALGKKVVMISGVTIPENEFSVDCLRVHSNASCNSCFNKTEDYEFDAGDWLWCPEFRDTERQFECTKSISHLSIIAEIVKIGWI
jgi:autotransporter strand-loop-strand O-heptosyltransferase